MNDAPNLPTASDAPHPAAEGGFLETINSRVKPRQVSTLLLWLVAGFFVIFLIWAYFAEIDRTVHGVGRVVPGPRLQTVSNFEGGIVPRHPRRCRRCRR